MRKILWISVILLALTACSPVLNRDLMNRGIREVPFSGLRETPDAYEGKLFILGGLIVESRFTGTGSQIEALAVPVDSLGYLESSERSQGRFLAVNPRSQGLLDPLVYRRGREVTIAGTFIEARKGKIDEMDYVYPVFEIKQIYLWDERKDYYNSPGYYSNYPYYNSPFMSDRWGRPYPYPYWPYQPMW
jgi:outer membrane lipoprotein